MKLSRAIVLLLIVLILGISTWNMLQLKRCKRSFEEQKMFIAQKNEILKKKESMIISAQVKSMKYLGNNLLWNNIKKIYPKNEDQLDFERKPKLVLILSEFSCDVCQDSETKFAVDIADTFGDDFVLAIVQARNKRYIINYIKQNHVNFPVYYCEDDKFFELNQLLNTPLIFILDKEDRIIASHLPITGYSEYSEPIHQFCFYYFNQNIKND